MMTRMMYRSLLWAVWGMTALWFSAGFAPAIMHGQDSPVPLNFEGVFPEPSSTEFTAEPPPPTMPHSPIEAPAAVLGNANCPSYWIVSSRCDVQHKHERHLDDGVLDVYQRSPEGALLPSDMGALSAQIIPGVPVLICVHGSFVTWNDECVESHAAYQWIRNACPELPLQVIFFTWPSEGLVTGLLPMDVGLRGRQAEFNSFHIAKVVSCLPSDSPVSFLGHSHGCRAILSTLHLAGGGSIQGLTYPGSLGGRRYRAVLAAAAVDHHWLNPRDRYGCAVTQAECIAILRNRKDLALATYPLHRPFAGRALARSGLTHRDERKLGALGQKVIEIDVTEYEGRNHLWPGYFTVPEIATEIAPYVYFPGAAQYVTPSIEMPAPSEPTPVNAAFLPPSIAPEPTTTTSPAAESTDADTSTPEAPPRDDFQEAPKRQAVMPGRKVDRDRIPLFVPKAKTEA